MAHYAKLDDNNIVLTVHVVSDADETNNGVVDEETARAFLEKHSGWANWKKTSYNTHGGQHKLGGTPFRGNYAGIGMTYDPINDIFIGPKPHTSWTLDVPTASWVAPHPAPSRDAEGKCFLNGNLIDVIWSETNQKWEAFDDSEPVPAKVATWNPDTLSWDT